MNARQVEMSRNAVGGDPSGTLEEAAASRRAVLFPRPLVSKIIFDNRRRAELEGFATDDQIVTGDPIGARAVALDVAGNDGAGDAESQAIGPQRSR